MWDILSSDDSAVQPHESIHFSKWCPGIKTRPLSASKDLASAVCGLIQRLDREEEKSAQRIEEIHVVGFFALCGEHVQWLSVRKYFYCTDNISIERLLPLLHYI